MEIFYGDLFMEIFMETYFSKCSSGGDAFALQVDPDLKDIRCTCYTDDGNIYSENLDSLRKAMILNLKPDQ